MPGAFAFGGPDKNLAFGSEADEAEIAREAAANRVKQSVQPDAGRAEGPITQAMEISPDDAKNFMRGGLYGALKGRGVETPEWADRAADFMQSPAVNDALAVGAARFWNAPRLLMLRQLEAQGLTQAEIAQRLGAAQSSVQRALTAGKSAGSPSLPKVRGLEGPIGSSDREIADYAKALSEAPKKAPPAPSVSRPAPKASSMTDWEVGPDGTMTRRTR